MSVLKGISGNDSLTRIVLYDLERDHLLTTSHFVLYDRGWRDHLLRSIIDRLPTSVQKQFIIDKYTTKSGRTFPCVSRSASGESTDSIVVVYSICVGELCGGSCVGGNPNAPCPLWASRVFS